MPDCPKCGSDNKAANEWVGGTGTKKTMNVARYVCSNCGTGYVVWRDVKGGTYKVMTRKRT